MIKRFDGANWVDVSSVRRFNGSNWVDCSEVKRFDGANWTKVFPTQVDPILYQSGDECVNTTGGWFIIPSLNRFSCNGEKSYRSMNFIKASDTYNDVGTSFRTNKQIDFSGYNKIKINYSANASNRDSRFIFAISTELFDYFFITNLPLRTPDSFQACHMFENSISSFDRNYERIIDISGVKKGYIYTGGYVPLIADMLYLAITKVELLP